MIDTEPDDCHHIALGIGELDASLAPESDAQAVADHVERHAARNL